MAPRLLLTALMQCPADETQATQCRMPLLPLSPQQTSLNKLLSDRVRDEVGAPTLRFEMDMLDKRFTPPAELRRIMTEFFTTL